MTEETHVIKCYSGMTTYSSDSRGRLMGQELPTIFCHQYLDCVMNAVGPVSNGLAIFGLDKVNRVIITECVYGI